MKSILRISYRLWSSARLLSSGGHVIKQQKVPKPESTETAKYGYPKMVPIILCKNEKLNHHKGQKYDQISVIPLASEGWHHRKAKGDHFVIQNNDVPLIDNQVCNSFKDFDLPSVMVENLENHGIIHATYIQSVGIKHILKGHHTLLASETGSGKTFAYLLPLLTQISSRKANDNREKLNCPFGIIITPNRELAHQICETAKMFTESVGLNVEVLTGGGTKNKILSPTFKEVDLLVATIGALNKLINTGVYRVSHVRHVVVDEADTLLDDSFNSSILQFLRKFRYISSSGTADDDRPCIQLTLASATFPTNLDELLGEFISLQILKRVSSPHLHYIPSHVRQTFYRIGHNDKAALLFRLVKADASNNNPVLIFSNKPATCDWLSLYLNENNVKCINLSKSLHYSDRLRRFQEFQTGSVNVLSSTDMGSRGLDTIRVKHVINYDFPLYMADYVHRCGRTGRIGSPEDCHISHFVTGPMEIDLVKRIELSIRRGQALQNVNANIKRLLNNRISKEIL